MRYKYYVNDNQVICVSKYAGKPVRGIAKCHPDDDFDIEAGKKLSRIRCDEKVAFKRLVRAKKKCLEASSMLIKANEYATKMGDYYKESLDDYIRVQSELTDINLTGKVI